jgi:hypothetical protein
MKFLFALASWPIPRVAVFVTIAIPLLISIFATITDEMAESGADRFRGALTLRRVCVNVQWSASAFYFGISRGALYPTATSDVRDFSSVLMIVSLVAALLGTVLIRRYAWLVRSVALPLSCCCGLAQSCNPFELRSQTRRNDRTEGVQEPKTQRPLYGRLNTTSPREPQPAGFGRGLTCAPCKSG